MGEDEPIASKDKDVERDKRIYLSGRCFDAAVDERLRSILAERYIHTPMNQDLWFLLEDIMKQADHLNPKTKVVGRLITAPPDSGKTTAIRQFKKAYMENASGARESDVILFRIPGRVLLKGVMYKLGTQLNIPDLPSGSHSAYTRYPTFSLIEKIGKKLWKDRTKLLIFDEFQKLFDMSPESRVEILNGFNELVNESHIPIVLVGVNGVDKILDLEYYDDRGNLKGTFCSRFPEYKMGLWTNKNDTDYIKLLHTIYEGCTSKSEEPLDLFYKDGKIRGRILILSEGLTGRIINLVKWTIRNQYRRCRKYTITLKILEDTFKEIKARGWME